MKFCMSCGADLKDNDCFCTTCGHLCEPTASLNSQTNQRAADSTAKQAIYNVEDIERNVLNYYIKNYGDPQHSGNFVVLHSETVINNDICTVVVRYLSTPNAFANTHVADVSVNMITGNVFIQSKMIQKKESSGAAITTKNTICICLVVLAIFSWLLVPFIDILGTQLSAYQLISRILST